MSCPRPDLLTYGCLRDLYLGFEELFLGNAGSTTNVLESRCGHVIYVFDHHFFHMVKLDHPTKPKPLLMGEEKQIILATVDGFGPYTHDKQRAIYLPAAALTLTEPDEVWEDSTLKTADWVYIKEFRPEAIHAHRVPDWLPRRGTYSSRYQCACARRPSKKQMEARPENISVKPPRPPSRAALVTRGDFTR